MGVDVDARVLALLKELLDVVEVVSADQNTRTAAHADVHLRYFGIAESCRIGFVQQGHRLHAPFAGFQHQGGEFIGIVAGYQLTEGLKDELVDVAVHLTEACGVLQVGGHAFESIHSQLFQRANVLVGFGQHANGLGFLVVLFTGAVPFQHIEFRQFNALLVGHAVFEHIAQLQSLVNAGVDALHIEVGVGDSAEQRIVHEGMDALAEVAVVVSAAVLVMVGDDT